MNGYAAALQLEVHAFAWDWRSDARHAPRVQPGPVSADRCGSTSRQSPCHSSAFPITTFSAIVLFLCSGASET